VPKGGGAIRDVGGEFSVNAAAGTGSLTIPVSLSAGRSGFKPTLSLSYDSGAGNGLSGFGWQVTLSTITRKTDKRLPRYLDDGESDAFILSSCQSSKLGPHTDVPVTNGDTRPHHPSATEIPNMTLATRLGSAKSS
jgi:hypothetical protein